MGLLLLTAPALAPAAAGGAAEPAADSQCAGQLLYNNVCLPKEWPPRGPISKVPVTPGYLTNPPATINIDVGRQLFVDDFLLDSARSTGVHRVHHNATYRDESNPVLSPTEPWEGAVGKTPPGMPFAEYGFASAFSGGLWWDPAAGIYKMWYRCGNTQCYATSEDGISWTKPRLPYSGKYAKYNGTNVVDASPLDGATVWLDLRPGVPADERYKMAIVCAISCSHYTLKYSADGIKWREVLNETGPTQDRASIFFNPFTSKWVYSIKQGIASADPKYDLGRSRKFWHGDDLIEAGKYTAEQPVNWTNADFLDPEVGCVSSPGNSFTQLCECSTPPPTMPPCFATMFFSLTNSLSNVDVEHAVATDNLDAVAYESVLVGLFSIFTGKECGKMCNVTGEKCSPYNRTGEWDSVFLGYSRDGFQCAPATIYILYMQPINFAANNPEQEFPAQESHNGVCAG